MPTVSCPKCKNWIVWDSAPAPGACASCGCATFTPPLSSYSPRPSKAQVLNILANFHAYCGEVAGVAFFAGLFVAVTLGATAVVLLWSGDSCRALVTTFAAACILPYAGLRWKGARRHVYVLESLQTAAREQNIQVRLQHPLGVALFARRSKRPFPGLVSEAENALYQLCREVWLFLQWATGPGKYVVFRVLVGVCLLIALVFLGGSFVLIGIPLLILDLFLAAGTITAIVWAVFGGLAVAALKIAFLLIGGSRIAEGLEKDEEKLVLRGVISIFGGWILAGLDGVGDAADALDAVDAASSALDAHDAGTALLPELSGDGFGPLDLTYGQPSLVDGDMRVDHYVEGYARGDGTEVAGHWKSQRG